MADGTRMKTIEEGLHKNDFKVAQALDLSTEINQRLDTQKAQFEEAMMLQKAQIERLEKSQLELIKSNQELLNNQKLSAMDAANTHKILSNIYRELSKNGGRGAGSREVNGVSRPEEENLDPNISIQDRRAPRMMPEKSPMLEFQKDSEQSSSVSLNSRGNNRFPKLEFPVFDGMNPRSWVRKAEKYFRIFSIDELERIEVATMYMSGRADNWAQGFLMQSRDVPWEEFAEAVCARFGEKQGVDVVEDFNKLIQQDDVEQL